ncbi:MAG: DUF3040 domain-containing protein [Streptosporangiaceae bacterium]
MSLSRRDRRMLREAAGSLAKSDPGLASMLALFNQLTSGEPVPGRQRARPRRALAALAGCAARGGHWLLRASAADAPACWPGLLGPVPGAADTRPPRPSQPGS